MERYRLEHEQRLLQESSSDHRSDSESGDSSKKELEAYITPSASQATASDKSDAEDSKSIRSKKSYSSEVELITPNLDGSQ